MRPLYLFIILCCFTTSINAQTDGNEELEPCFDELYQAGKDSLAMKNYPEAFKLFIVARNCHDKKPQNRLDYYIRQTSNRWVNDLAAAKQEAINERNSTYQEKLRADRLRVLAEVKTKEAVDEKEKADIQRQDAERLKIFSQALVFTFKAQDSLDYSKNIQGLHHSYCAYQELISHNESIKYISDPLKQANFKSINIPEDVVKVFGRAVYANSQQTTQTKQQDILSYKIAKTENRLLTIGRDQTLKIWDIKPALNKAKLNLPSLKVADTYIDSIYHEDYILSATFSDDGRQVIYCTKDGKTFIWSESDKQSQALKEHDDAVTQGIFLKDKVITISRDGYLRTWDKTTKKLLGKKVNLGFPLLEVFTNSAETKAFVRAAYQVFIVDLVSGEYKSIDHSEKYVYTLSLSPDETALLTTSADGTACIWDLEGTPTNSIKHTNHVYTASFNPNPTQQEILTGSDKVRLVNYIDDNREDQKQVSSDNNKFRKVLFSSDGQIKVALAGDDTYHILDSKTNSVKAKGYITSIALSTTRDSLHNILTGCSTWLNEEGKSIGFNNVQLWNDNKELLTEIPIDNPVLGVQFLKEGEFIFFITKNGAVSISPNPSSLFLDLYQNPNLLGINCNQLIEVEEKK